MFNEEDGYPIVFGPRSYGRLFPAEYERGSDAKIILEDLPEGTLSQCISAFGSHESRSSLALLRSNSAEKTCG